MRHRALLTLTVGCATAITTVAMAPMAAADPTMEKGDAKGAEASDARVTCGSRPADIDRRSYANLFAYDGVNMRSGPSTSCTILGRGYLSNQLDYHCYAVGQSVNGYTTWTYLRNVTTGKYGWVNDSLLDANADGIRGSLVYC